ncbi:hypothetical protein GGR88_000467 [Sphingomonas jejuensis]|uniref:DUF6438 domain-containing protein n=1 Tax=Sphingomonas jejuensis TaxID=904715 RepID=A0ABX0XIK4_9SPHN|nr:DUF6438 domain-containing protein [Sphingomonas jejuensis]NJC32993.1 hypothetical protein [Sphingomonas jejuensis]
MRTATICGAAMLLAGCQMTSDVALGGAGAQPRPIEVESITYRTSPCYGTCPVYAVTVQPDGTGLFVGERFTATTGERGFRLTPARYQAFKALLSPLRPTEERRDVVPGEAGCESYATDQSGVHVTWTELSGATQELHYDLGCNKAAGDGGSTRLREAPSLLPIEGLVGRR